MTAARGQVSGPRVRRSVMRFCVCRGNGPLGRRFGTCGCGGTEEFGQNEEQNKTEKNNPSLSSFRTCM